MEENRDHQTLTELIQIIRQENLLMMGWVDLARMSEGLDTVMLKQLTDATGEEVSVADLLQQVRQSGKRISAALEQAAAAMDA